MTDWTELQKLLRQLKRADNAVDKLQIKLDEARRARDELASQVRAAMPATPMTRAPAKEPVNGARPRGEIQAKIYEHILAHPEAGYREIVVAVYGEYTELKYNSTRNAIASMKRNGWISGERGEWVLGKGEDAA
jgi:hypothetical protein